MSLLIAVCLLLLVEREAVVVASGAIGGGTYHLDRKPLLGKESSQRGTRASENNFLTFSLFLNFTSAEEFGGSCLAGRTAGLGDTTLRLEQRFPFAGGDDDEWILVQRNIPLDHGLFMIRLPTFTNCINFRLVQEEHGGGSCNCWSVTSPERSDVDETFVMCNTTASQRRIFNCIYCLTEDNTEEVNCTNTPEPGPPFVKPLRISESCSDTRPHLNVNFQIIFNGNDTGCDTVMNFNEGVEFAMRFDDDEVWIPLAVIFRNHGNSNGITLGNLSNLIIRDYLVDAPNKIQVNETDLFKVSLRLCDFNRVASSIQFRWLQTSRFGGENVPLRDLWGLDDLQVSLIQESGEQGVILSDSFDSVQLNPKIWPLEGIRDANLSTTCTVDPNDQALMFGLASRGVDVNEGQRFGPVASRSIRTASLSINNIEPISSPPPSLSLPTDLTTTNRPRPQSCKAEIFNGLEWPDTAPGDLASVKCPCADSQDAQALRWCRGNITVGAVWSSETDTSLCLVQDSTVTGRLCNAALTAGNSTEQLEIANEVATITASNSTVLTAADISLIATVVEQITAGAVADPQIREPYLEIIDSVQNADTGSFLRSQTETQSSQRILNSLATFLDTLAINDSSTGGLTLGLDNYALNLQDIDFNNFKGHTLAVNLGSNDDALISDEELGNSLKITPETVIGRLTNLTATVQIPERILKSNQDCNQSNIHRLSYSVFLSDILFQSPNQSRFDIGSIIVSARIRCAANSTLSAPVRTYFRTSNSQSNTNASNGSCAVWDPRSDRFGAWSTSGCREVEGGNGEQTVCECNQLGHFGILFDLSPRPLNPDAALALFIITYIGIIISLLCLGILILTYLASKKLRRDTHAQVLLNMSVSLAGLYIFFMLGGHVTGIPVLCGFTAALLHYFMLVFFAWTAVEAVLLYIKFVVIMGTESHENHFALKSGIAAWILPGLIVMLSAGPGYRYYISDYYCRSTEWPFWFGLVLPFVIVYIFDWIMFVVILTSVIKRRSRSKKMSVNGLQDGDKRKFKTFRENFIIALSLSVVFGLGWGFGLLATSSPVEGLTIALQVIFSIFVGAQGLLLFILHGVRNTDVRKVWKGWLATVTACCCSKEGHVTRKVVLTGTNSSSLNPLDKEQIDLDERLPR